jgi:hypothetical protein
MYLAKGPHGPISLDILPRAARVSLLTPSPRGQKPDKTPRTRHPASSFLRRQTLSEQEHMQVFDSFGQYPVRTKYLLFRVIDACLIDEIGARFEHRLNASKQTFARRGNVILMRHNQLARVRKRP